MKENFRCPRCKRMQHLGKRLHASWQCPDCGNTIIPTKRDQMLGYRPFKYNSMYKMFSTFKPNFKKTYQN